MTEATPERTKEVLTQSRLRELLYYNHSTGEFTWLVSRGRKAGKRAGSLDTHGYRLIRVDWNLYRSCRLAWLYMHGQWPDFQIDHINMDRSDDRWSNLRAASNSQNNMNRRVRRDSTSGLKGVTWDARSGKWLSIITANGKTTRLGAFNDAARAHQCYARAAQKLHGEFARTQ